MCSKDVFLIFSPSYLESNTIVSIDLISSTILTSKNSLVFAFFFVKIWDHHQEGETIM